MLEVFVYLITVTVAVAIGIRIGRRKEPRIVGSETVPLVVANGQRVILGEYDMTVASIVLQVPNERGPAQATLDLVDSADWDKKRRVS